MTDSEQSVLKRSDRRAPRAATAECADCHFIFEKPFMHEDYDVASPGRYVPSRTTTYRDKYGNAKGTSQTESRFTNSSYKKVWLCDSCKQIRKQKRRRNRLIGIFVFSLAIFSVYLFLLRPSTTRSKSALANASSDTLMASQQDKQIYPSISPNLYEQSQTENNNVLSENVDQRPIESIENNPASDNYNTQDLSQIGNLLPKQDDPVLILLQDKIADKLRRSEQRSEFDWTTRSKGVKFRIVVGDKTASESSTCRSVSVELLDGIVTSFENEQMWCKSDGGEMWVANNK